MSVRRIAKDLRISPSTVSLALRNSPKIPAETRQRVIAHAGELGYRPNAKLKEVMSQLRLVGVRPKEACFGVISFYDSPRPWERSRHLTRLFDSMRRHADQLGYRLEPLWLRAPGMTPRRFRSILDARGIQGLISFGSPNVDEIFPAELDHYAIVTVGLSIATPLHRVTSHFFNDVTHALHRLQALGYRRPGIVIGRYEDHRSAHAATSAYLGWCEFVHGVPGMVPVLRLERVEEAPFLSWLHAHQPDVILFVHLYDVVQELKDVLNRNGIRLPQDLGVLAVSQFVEGTGFAGLEQNQELMGAWSIEMLVSRINHQDFGISENPRIEMVEGRWIEGASLRSQPVEAVVA
jgi:DNA-binding LacI/PurR family transcriptional regulator